MEPVQESISGRMQLEYMKLEQEMEHLPGSGESPPSWWPSVLYSNDPLWDGQDCNGREHTCCDPPNLPWFCKELPQPTTDYLKVLQACLILDFL